MARRDSSAEKLKRVIREHSRNYARAAIKRDRTLQKNKAERVKLISIDTAISDGNRLRGASRHLANSPLTQGAAFINSQTRDMLTTVRHPGLAGIENMNKWTAVLSSPLNQARINIHKSSYKHLRSSGKKLTDHVAVTAHVYETFRNTHFPLTATNVLGKKLNANRTMNPAYSLNPRQNIIPSTFKYGEAMTRSLGSRIVTSSIFKGAEAERRLIHSTTGTGKLVNALKMGAYGHGARVGYDFYRNPNIRIGTGRFSAEISKLAAGVIGTVALSGGTYAYNQWRKKKETETPTTQFADGVVNHIKNNKVYNRNSYAYKIKRKLLENSSGTKM